MDVYARLKKLGIELTEHTPRGGLYTSTLFFGEGERLAYVSGTGPAFGREDARLGRVGRDLTLAQGREEARYCMRNILSNLHHDLGDLNRIRRFVKLTVFVASADDFHQQPQVADGASALLRDVFSETAQLPARSAVGVNVLPGNIPVEIEALLELTP